MVFIVPPEYRGSRPGDAQAELERVAFVARRHKAAERGMSREHGRRLRDMRHAD